MHKKALVFISTELVCYFQISYLFAFSFFESILLSHDFPWLSLEFHDFPGLKIEILNPMTFLVFHDLYEPCEFNMTGTNTFNYVPLKKYLAQIHSQKLRVLHERDGSQKCSHLQHTNIDKQVLVTFQISVYRCLSWPTEHGRTFHETLLNGIHSHKTTLWYCSLRARSYTLYEVIWIKTSHHYHRQLFIELEGAFFWGDVHQNQWSKITQIIVHQRIRWIHPVNGFISSFEAPWSNSQQDLLEYQ